MTSRGDICTCGDIASPGYDLCGGCLTDALTARRELAAAIAQITAENEARRIDEDEVSTPYQETT